MTTRLVFGAAGAIAGSFTPLGAQAGWLLGSYFGQVIDPADDPEMIRGNRLSDLKSGTVSEPGVMVTYVAGRIRIPTVRIWAPDKVEHVNVTTVESEGGKGSPPEQKQEEVFYTASFADALCEGEIADVPKIWANSKLAGDNGEATPVRQTFTGLFTIFNNVELPAAVDQFYNAVTIYTGSATQTQDPTIANIEGGANTPGYRDTAMLVFKELDLSPYFQNHPQIEAEVVKSGTASIMVPVVFYPLPGGAVYSAGGEDFAYRRNSPGAIYFWAVLEDGGGDPRTLALFENYGGTLVWSSTESDDTSLLSEHGLNGRVWVQVRDEAIYAIAPTGQRWEFDNFGGIDVNRVEQIYEFKDPTLDTDDSQEDAPEIFLQYNPDSPGTRPIYHGNAMAMSALVQVDTDRSTNTFLDSADRIAGRVYIKCTQFLGALNSRIGYCESGSDLFHTIRDYDTGGEPHGMVGRDGYLYVRSGDAGFYNVIEKMDPEGNVVDSLTLPGLTDSDTSVITMVQNAYGALYVQANAKLFRINYGTMELIDTATLANSNDRILPDDTYEGRGVLVARKQAGERDTVFILRDSIASEEPSVADFASENLQKAGYTIGQFDVSLCTGMPVHGYAVRRRMTWRARLAPILDANFVDVVESDGKLKFVPRGGASVATIPLSDLGAHTGDRNEPVERLKINRLEELDFRVPVEVTVLYVRRESDYGRGMQNSKRLTTPSKHTETIEYPIVLTDDEAKRIADKKAFSKAYEREFYNFSTGRKWCWLEPTDVITIDGHIMRIVDKQEGGNGVIEWAAVADLSSLHTQISVGAVTSQVPKTMAIVGPTDLVFGDWPLLRNEDDNAGAYLAARGVATGWRGYQLYRSTDSGVPYTAVDGASSSAAPATIGVAVTALPAIDADHVEIIDEGNYLDVLMQDGATLASVTRAELFDGANFAAIGREVIQFRDAELIGTDLYRLTGLLRARRGTEIFMAHASAGERFVLLDAKLRTMTDTSANKGQPVYYKAVSHGRTLQSTNPLVFTNTARRKTPLSPVRLGAGQNSAGDWLMQWQRRTRYTPVWLESGDVPLGESSESYVIRIYDGETVLRTLYSSTPTVTYTAAEQITDWGYVQGSLRFSVAMISDEVGEGDMAEHFVNHPDPYAANVVLLMHFDGADGDQTFTDERGHVFTPSGANAVLDTAFKRFGASSLTDSGGLHYISTPWVADWEFGSGDFTIEFWFRWTGLPTPNTNGALVCSVHNSTTFTPFLIYRDQSAMRVYMSNDGATWNIANNNVGGTLVIGNTYHWALTRQGTVFRTFLNGVQAGTWTSALTMGTAGTGLFVGNTMKGNLDELRITKGVARYTAAFTPPGDPFDI